MSVRWHHIVVLMCTAFRVHSQELSAAISDKEIRIGVPITLTYSVNVNSGDSIVFQQEQNTISGQIVGAGGSLSNKVIEVEIADAFRDTFVVKNGKSTWSGQYVITSWDEGQIRIPGPDIIINDSTFYFEDLEFTCVLVAKDSVDLYDVKEDYEEIPDPPMGYRIRRLLKNNWWWMAFLVLGGITYLLVRRYRKKKKKAPVPKRLVSLKERTLMAIDALDAERMWERNRLKEHFVELSYILRSYLTGRYGISLLEKTTLQIKILLREKGLSDDTIEVIARILSQSDMVKFAKSNPDVAAILKQSTLARQVVAETSPLDFDNVD